MKGLDDYLTMQNPLNGKSAPLFDLEAWAASFFGWVNILAMFAAASAAVAAVLSYIGGGLRLPSLGSLGAMVGIKAPAAPKAAPAPSGAAPAASFYV